MVFSSWWHNVITEIGDFLTGEYFLNIGSMILRVDDKDIVRERHFNGADMTTNGTVATQKYYDPYTQTEKDYKPATGKEILCYVVWAADQQPSTNVFKIWANTTKNSKTGARDVFGGSFTSQNADPFDVPPFVLKAGEYLNVERISGAAANQRALKIVGVERDAT